LVARSIAAAGGRPGDTVHISYSYGLFTGGFGAHYGAEWLGCNVVPVSNGQTARQVRLLEDFRPRLIMATPSYMMALAEEFDRQGLDPTRSSLELAICGAEPWTESMRKQIEDRFAVDALDMYGLSEIMGPGVAQEFLASKGGPCIWEDHFYPEIMQDSTPFSTSDDIGELVLTTLSREACPLIRYRTGDVTGLLPPNDTPMRRISRIRGRCDDMLIVRGVNVFPSQVEELILTCSTFGPHYQLEMTKRGALDELTVHVEPACAESSNLSESAKRLGQAATDHLGLKLEVAVHPVNSLPRSFGKSIRVVDNR
jgi:phenylacetate-CoA ligase